MFFLGWIIRRTNISAWKRRVVTGWALCEVVHLDVKALSSVIVACEELEFLHIFL